MTAAPLAAQPDTLSGICRSRVISLSSYMVIYSLQHDMGWGSMNNGKPRITLNLYEMRFSPQHCFKKENIDSGGVQRFRALGELTFCWSMPTLALHGHKRAAVCAIPHLISADKAGEGREGSVTFAAASRCCRFYWVQVPGETSLSIIHPFSPVTAFECKLGWMISICFPF